MFVVFFVSFSQCSECVCSKLCLIELTFLNKFGSAWLAATDSNGAFMTSNGFGDRGIIQRRSLRNRLRRSIGSFRGSSYEQYANIYLSYLVLLERCHVERSPLICRSDKMRKWTVVVKSIIRDQLWNTVAMGRHFIIWKYLIICV